MMRYVHVRPEECLKTLTINGSNQPTIPNDHLGSDKLRRLSLQLNHTFALEVVDETICKIINIAAKNALTRIKRAIFVPNTKVTDGQFNELSRVFAVLCVRLAAHRGTCFPVTEENAIYEPHIVCLNRLFRREILCVSDADMVFQCLGMFRKMEVNFSEKKNTEMSRNTAALRKMFKVQRVLEADKRYGTLSEARKLELARVFEHTDSSFGIRTSSKRFQVLENMFNFKFSKGVTIETGKSVVEKIAVTSTFSPSEDPVLSDLWISINKVDEHLYYSRTAIQDGIELSPVFVPSYVSRLLNNKSFDNMCKGIPERRPPQTGKRNKHIRKPKVLRSSMTSVQPSGEVWIGVRCFLQITRKRVVVDKPPVSSIEQFAFVPKSPEISRTVVTQGISRFYLARMEDALTKFAKSFPTSVNNKNTLFLTQQNYSRELVRNSVDFRTATVDLSSASDSIVLKFMQRFLPKICEYLIKYSSDLSSIPTKALTDLDPEEYEQFVVRKLKNDTLLKLPLFTGMGSTFCFPLQSIIFYTITQFAMNKVLSKNEIHIVDTTDCIKVFGDDIAMRLPTSVALRTCNKIYSEVVTLLSDFGFIVNELKSFCFESPIAEVCGCYFYKNMDIRPINLTRPLGMWSGYENDSVTLRSLATKGLTSSFNAGVNAVCSLYPDSKKAFVTSGFAFNANTLPIILEGISYNYTAMKDRSSYVENVSAFEDIDDINLFVYKNLISTTEAKNETQFLYALILGLRAKSLNNTLGCLQVYEKATFPVNYKKALTKIVGCKGVYLPSIRNTLHLAFSRLDYDLNIDWNIYLVFDSMVETEKCAKKSGIVSSFQYSFLHYRPDNISDLKQKSSAVFTRKTGVGFTGINLSRDELMNLKSSLRKRKILYAR